MPVTDPYFICHPANARRVRTSLDKIERITNRSSRRQAPPHPQPVFHEIETRVVILRFAEAIAEVADFTPEHAFELHHVIGKFAQRDPQEGPGSACPQANPDQMNKTALVDYDGRRACPGNPAMAKNRVP